MDHPMAFIARTFMEHIMAFVAGICMDRQLIL